MILALLQLAAAATLDPEARDTLEAVGPVRVQYVRATHWAISRRDEIAKAIRTENGQKWIVVNLDANLTDFDQWLLHEMAHHAAWDEHGEDIEPHGPEFRAACRALVTTRQDYFCKGD